MSADRERRALVALARFGRLRPPQLETFICDESALGCHAREVATWRSLRSLRRHGLVAATARGGGGYGGASGRVLYQLTEAGARHLAKVEPSLSDIASRRGGGAVEHALMTADVYLAFVTAARRHDGHRVSEWEPDWRMADLLGSRRVIPDGHFVYTSDEWEVGAFVEVDLGSERPVRFARKVAEYISLLQGGTWRAALPYWPLVLTVTPEVGRAALLDRQTERVLRRQRGADELARVAEFRFAALPDLCGPEGPLGRIWKVAGRDGLHPLIPSDANAATDAEARSMPSRGPIAGAA